VCCLDEHVPISEKEADLCCVVQLQGAQGLLRLDQTKTMVGRFVDMQQPAGGPQKDDTGLCLRQIGRAAIRYHCQHVADRRCELFECIGCQAGRNCQVMTKHVATNNH
jgi:hypothetical protein